MTGAGSFSARQAVGQQHPQHTTTLANSGSAVVREAADDLCGIEPTVMTDEEREAAIVRAGEAMVRYMGVWHEEGCFAARGDAHRARRLMELLIAGRSKAQIARMEEERGLSGR